MINITKLFIIFMMILYVSASCDKVKIDKEVSNDDLTALCTKCTMHHQGLRSCYWNVYKKTCVTKLWSDSKIHMGTSSACGDAYGTAPNLQKSLQSLSVELANIALTMGPSEWFMVDMDAAWAVWDAYNFDNAYIASTIYKSCSKFTSIETIALRYMNLITLADTFKDIDGKSVDLSIKSINLAKTIIAVIPGGDVISKVLDIIASTIDISKTIYEVWTDKTVEMTSNQILLIKQKMGMKIDIMLTAIKPTIAMCFAPTIAKTFGTTIGSLMTASGLPDISITILNNERAAKTTDVKKNIVAAAVKMYADLDPNNAFTCDKTCLRSIDMMFYLKQIKGKTCITAGDVQNTVGNTLQVVLNAETYVAFDEMNAQKDTLLVSVNKNC
jgi:hypothetical protein